MEESDVLHQLGSENEQQQQQERNHITLIEK